MTEILVVDNYDSFTYNLVYLIRDLGFRPTVWRNDQFRLDQVKAFDKIVLSPGPGIPSEAGLMTELLNQFSSSKSILGVCLGHQAIGEAFGCQLINLTEVYHGVATEIEVISKDESLFSGMPSRFQVGRYHSWAIEPDSVSDILEVTAIDAKGQVMAVSHKQFDVKGVQFHPESILTENGKKMLQNWLKY